MKSVRLRILNPLIFTLLSLALLFSGVILYAGTAAAAIRIPKNLSAGDRDEALRIIGLGTSSKILSDPYPMGGYSGFEFGISIENLPTDDLGRLGSGLPTPQQEVAFPKLTIGKGLYNGLDMFVHFTPYSRQDELSQYGGIGRWCFFETERFPLSLSLLIHGNVGNVGNLLTTRSYGADIIAGINVDNVALFGGGGPIEAVGTFAGGTNGVTNSNAFESAKVSGAHTVVGANVHFLENIFVTLQIDRYSVPVFSGKLGVRF
ncbi:MAG: hypothetical protein V4692_10500 [Bdellovibrionota bacterium]